MAWRRDIRAWLRCCSLKTERPENEGEGRVASALDRGFHGGERTALFSTEDRSMTRRMLAVAGLALLAAAGLSDDALAQLYKGKTLTMIINYPAGGPNDIEGRIIAQHLPNHIPGKPTIVVKNVTGAGGIIGTNALSDSAPNGETMGFFTPDLFADLLKNPSLKTSYVFFIMTAGTENP